MRKVRIKRLRSEYQKIHAESHRILISFRLFKKMYLDKGLSHAISYTTATKYWPNISSRAKTSIPRVNNYTEKFRNIGNTSENIGTTSEKILNQGINRSFWVKLLRFIQKLFKK